METQTAINLMVAAVAAHSFHSLMEPLNIRAKVARLKAYMDKKPYKEMSLKIDTRAKALGLGYGMFIFLLGAGFLVTNTVDPSAKQAAYFAFVLMVFVELVNTANIDKYHIDIEVLTKRFKK